MANHNNIATAPPEFQPYSQIHLLGTVPTPVTMPQLQVGPQSMEITCPQCRCRITTTVRHKATTKTHMACLLLSFFCFWTLCCCFLPYCMGSCQNANHFCPMCNTYLGTYQS